MLVVVYSKIKKFLQKWCAHIYYRSSIIIELKNTYNMSKPRNSAARLLLDSCKNMRLKILDNNYDYS